MGEKSFIDVTLETSVSGLCVREWRIEDWVTGSHKAIFIEVGVGVRDVQVQKVKSNWDRGLSLKDVKWRDYVAKLDGMIKESKVKEVGSRRDVLSMEKEVREMLWEAAKGVIPRRGGRIKGNRRWDEELRDFKRIVIIVKRDIKKEKDVVKRKEIVKKYRLKLREYRNTIKQKKKESWETC